MPSPVQSRSRSNVRDELSAQITPMTSQRMQNFRAKNKDESLKRISHLLQSTHQARMNKQFLERSEPRRKQALHELRQFQKYKQDFLGLAKGGDQPGTGKTLVTAQSNLLSGDSADERLRQNRESKLGKMMTKMSQNYPVLQVLGYQRMNKVTSRLTEAKQSLTMYP